MILTALAAMAVTLPQMISPAPVVPRPAGQTLRGEGAIDVVLRLTISPVGDVERCTASVTSGDVRFDGRLCEIFGRTPFKPAEGVDGKATYGVISEPFHWAASASDEDSFAPDVDVILKQMPPGSAFHPMAKIAFVVDQQGHMANCELVSSAGIPALDAAACDVGVAAPNPPPAESKRGTKVMSVQSLNVGFAAYARTVFKKPPAAFAALGPAGGFFPEREQRENVSGYAILECDSDVHGVLTKCLVKDQSPTNSAFGAAAKKMAATQWMTVVPGSGNRVLIKMEFKAVDNFRAR
jgi:hypothetical protein